MKVSAAMTVAYVSLPNPTPALPEHRGGSYGTRLNDFLGNPAFSNNQQPTTRIALALSCTRPQID
jgi:hypothetical protein